MIKNTEKNWRIINALLEIAQSGLEIDDLACRPYKSYAALITPDGLNALAVVVEENSLGSEVTYSPDGDGGFFLTAQGAFPDIDKFFSKPIAIVDNNGVLRFLRIIRRDENTAWLIVYDKDGTSVDFTGFDRVPIEIRVYN